MSRGIKAGVSLAKLQPQAVLMDQIIASVYDDMGLNCIITSGSDGVHSVGSLHYKGFALDYRTNNVPETLRGTLVLKIRKALGADFDVVLEADHLHVEHDVKPKPDPGKTV